MSKTGLVETRPADFPKFNELSESLITSGLLLTVINIVVREFPTSESPRNFVSTELRSETKLDLILCLHC